MSNTFRVARNPNKGGQPPERKGKEEEIAKAKCAPATHTSTGFTEYAQGDITLFPDASERPPVEPVDLDNDQP